MVTYIIIFLSLLIVISHLFEIVQRKTHVPSVLFLIILGYLLNHLASYLFHFSYIVPPGALKMLGSIGLVLIVLEGVLAIKIKKSDVKIIKRAFLVAFIVLLASALSISCLNMAFTSITFVNSLLYSIPLSIISSAILIPSIHKLSDKTKDFMTYESVFSDIIGIFLFNFIANNELASFSSIPKMGLNLAAIITISIVSSYLLIFILSKITGNTKIILTIAILLLLYNLCHLLNLSALLLILVFGLIINNFGRFLKLFKIPAAVSNLFNKESVELASYELKQVNCEITFFIRTFFFLVFGFSMDLGSIINPVVIMTGMGVILIIYIIRFLYFKFLHTSILPEMFLAPRGLITILLFYSIPANAAFLNQEIGVLYFTVLMSIIIMTIGLISTLRKKNNIADTP